GTILARYPDGDVWVGRTLPEAEIVRTTLAQRQGTTEARGLDGVNRLFAFTPLGGAGAPEYVSAGLSTAGIDALTNQLLLRSLVGMLLAGALALIAAWFGHELFLLRRVRRLSLAAERLRAGDLSARAGVAGSPDELGQLTAGFDDMAQSLEEREAKLRA